MAAGEAGALHRLVSHAIPDIDMLRRASEDANRKLCDVARSLVRDAGSPAPSARR